MNCVIGKNKNNISQSILLLAIIFIAEFKFSSHFRFHHWLNLISSAINIIIVSPMTNKEIRHC